MKKIKVRNKLQKMRIFWLKILNQTKRECPQIKITIRFPNKISLQFKAKKFWLLQQPTACKILQLLAFKMQMNRKLIQ